MRHFDVVVIGGGIAGVHVAKLAASCSLDVCLIEKNKLGGSYLHWDTVPFNVLSEAAKKYKEVRDAKFLGIDCRRDFDFSSLLKRVDKTLSQISSNKFNEEYLGRIGVKVLKGSPKFLSKTVVELNHEKISAKKFVLATGSKPYVPNIEGLDSVNYLNSKDIFSLKNLPKSITILGGGMTGVELSFALSRFGCQVALLEQNSRILEFFDKDVSLYVKEILEKAGVKVFEDVLIKKVYHHSKRDVVEAINEKKKIVIKSDNLFLATGRMANVDDLDLSATGIKFDAAKVVVNKKCRTSSRKIFACGDVTGLMFASYAVHQADVIVSNLFHFQKFVDYRSVPIVLHTDPEIALLGRDEKSLKDCKSLRSVKVDFKDVDAGLFKDNEGFVKVVLKGSKIVGVVVASRNASETINSYSAVIDKNISSLRKISFPVASLNAVNSLILEKISKKKGVFRHLLFKVAGRI